MNFRVFVYGIPKGQPRSRAFARNGRVRVYDPGTAENWKSQIAQALQAHIPETPIPVPVTLFLRFFFPRPKSHFRRNGELRPSAPVAHTAKPDLDNAAKAVMDAMTQIGILADDALVYRMGISKVYADKSAGCSIELVAE